MDDRFNTIAGWVLFAGIIALGSSIVAGEMFHSERPEKMGYPIAGVEQEGEGGAAAEQPIETYPRQGRPGQGRADFQQVRRLPQRDQWRPQPARPEPLGRARRADRPGQGLCFLGCAVEKGRHLELGQSQPVADQPAQLRARNQDDLRRSQQPAGPRRRHRLLNQHSDAVRSRCPRRPPRRPMHPRKPGTGPNNGPQKAEKEPSFPHRRPGSRRRRAAAMPATNRAPNRN